MLSSVIQSSARAAANLRRVPLLRVTDRSRPNLTVAARARAYAICWLVSLVALTALVSLRVAHTPAPNLLSGSLEDKLSYYSLHKSDFDLILLGDSLTYTGLHPEFLDPELGTRSINMAIFAHWLATQYPYIEDLIPQIPRGTRVLWSVHLYDFKDDLSVQHIYPVGVINAVRYWSWGAHNPGLADNVLYYNPLTRFFFERDELRSRLVARGQTPESVPRFFPSALAAPEFPAAPAVGRAIESFADTPELRGKLNAYYTRRAMVLGVAPVSDRGHVNSVVLYLRGGGYYRIELTPEYFREKQREMAKSVWRPDDKTAEIYTPPPLGMVSLKMFEAGLAAFRKAGIPVTVNAMEEAPWTLPNKIVRQKLRRLVDETLQPIVRRYGDDYIHADYSSIVDADYFDYNHFNSNGIAKYTPLLVTALKKTPAFAHPHER